MEVIRKYIDADLKNIYGSKKVTLPKPEFMLFIQGNGRKGRKPYRLQNLFFRGRDAALISRLA